MHIELKPNAKIILQWLAQRHPSQRNNLALAVIANETGLHRNTIKTHIKMLRKSKLIRVHRCSQGRGHSFSFDVYPAGYFVLYERKDR